MPLVDLILCFEAIFRSRIYFGINPSFQTAPLATFVEHHSGILRHKLPRSGFVEVQAERNGGLTIIGNSHTDELISSRGAMRRLIKSRLTGFIKDRRQNHRVPAPDGMDAIV